MTMFEKFNSMIDLEGLKRDIKDAANSTGDFVDVPHGDYEVKVASMELGETSEKAKNPGMPMAKVRFQILAGEYAGQSIFMNQMLHKGFGINKFNQFMESLETGIPIEFENFEQYNALIEQVFDAVDGVYEYQLSYGENNKGYNVYEIIQKF